MRTMRRGMHLARIAFSNVALNCSYTQAAGTRRIRTLMPIMAMPTLTELIPCSCYNFHPFSSLPSSIFPLLTHHYLFFSASVSLGLPVIFFIVYSTTKKIYPERVKSFSVANVHWLFLNVRRWGKKKIPRNYSSLFFFFLFFVSSFLFGWPSIVRPLCRSIIISIIRLLYHWLL